MFGPSLGLQPDGDVGDAVVEAGEAPEEVDGEGAGGTLHICRELVGARCRLDPDFLDLLQQVAHGQDLVLMTAHRPRAHAGDLLQVHSRSWGEAGREREEDSSMLLFKDNESLVVYYSM